MAKIIAFANQKGGVGKTTSAINVAAALGSKRKNTLLVDFDPQGNSTSGVGIRKSQVKNTIYDALVGKASPHDCIIKTEYKNLSVMPSELSLAAAELELADTEKRGAEKLYIEDLRKEFDYILIDCPPSLGLLTVNALTASDGVVIPMQCEYFSLEGLSQIMMSIKQVKKLYNPTLAVTGILITMYNGRLNLSVQVVDELKKYYADKLFKATISRSVRLSEAPSYGAPIQYYDKYSPGSLAYDEVARELMTRI